MKGIERLFSRINALYSGKFRSQFKEDPHWQIAKQEWVLKLNSYGLEMRELGHALNDALVMLPGECPKFPPTLGEFCEILEYVISERSRMRTGRAQSFSALAHYKALAHIKPDSPVALEEMGKMTRILAGEPIEEVSGMTQQQHLKFLSGGRP